MGEQRQPLPPVALYREVESRAELIAGLIVLAAIGYLAKSRAAPLWSSLVLTGGVLLLSPTAYPWYFTWSIDPVFVFLPKPRMVAHKRH